MRILSFITNSLYAFMYIDSSLGQSDSLSGGSMAVGLKTRTVVHRTSVLELILYSLLLPFSLKVAVSSCLAFTALSGVSAPCRPVRRVGASLTAAQS